MATRLFSLLAGSVYLFLGICGCVGSFVSAPPAKLYYWDLFIIGNWGYLFGWLPVNIIHNILYIMVGVGGIMSAAAFRLARIYCIGLCWLTLQLTVIGFLPFGINYLWGLMPLFGWNVMVHTTTAIAAWYYGHIYPIDFGDTPRAVEAVGRSDH